MIKINLLGDDTVVDHSGRIILLGFVASWVVLVLVCIGIQASLNSDISAAQAEVGDLETRLAALKKTTEEVRELEKKKAELNQITATIAKLKLSQEGPVRFMDDLNASIPGRTWLRKITEKESLMTIVGMALKDEYVAQFMENLAKSDFVEEIDLKESVAIHILKITAYNYFNGKYTTFVERAEDREKRMAEIAAEAKSLGLEFSIVSGPPGDNKSGGDVTIMTGSTDSSGVLKSGVFRRGSGRREKLIAWSSVEPVPGKLFTVIAKIAYSGKLSTLKSQLEAATKTSAELEAKPIPAAAAAEAVAAQG